MQRIRVFGPAGVVFDEQEDSKLLITNRGTWSKFISDVPRKGTCKFSVGHPLSNGSGNRILAKHLAGYSFEEACDRVEFELKPDAG